MLNFLYDQFNSPSIILSQSSQISQSNKMTDGSIRQAPGVDDLLFIVTPIVGVCNCFMFFCMLLYVHSSFAIILMGKRELVAFLLSLSSWCLIIVVRLFLSVPWVCPQFLIVVFPDHTHLLFL